MEKYEARRDGEKTEKEQFEESNEKLAKTALKGAATYFAPGVGGTVVDMASNTKAGQKIIKGAGKLMQRTELGKHAVKLDKSGVTDAADKALDYVNPGSGAAGAAKGATSGAAKNGVSGATKNGAGEAAKNSLTKGSTHSDSSLGKSSEIPQGDELNNTSKSNKKSLLDFGGGNSSGGFNLDIVGLIGKKKLIIAGSVVFLFLIIMVSIVSAKDFGNLDLTNGSTAMPSGSRGSRNCTVEEVENNLLYVGDSRIEGMRDSLDNTNVQYVAASSQGYSWLTSTATSELESTIKDGSIVVLSLGVNDLYNIDNYINYYKELMAKYPNNTFYVMSVNPVDDAKASASGDPARNSDIEEFNNKLKSAFPDKYIDSYNAIKGSINTNDGVHYNTDTNKEINNYVTSSISSSGNTRCGTSAGAGGDLAGKLEEVGTWYIANVSTYQNGNSGSRKYYQTPFGSRSFGDDCTEFVAAYMSYMCGSDVPESYSGDMVYPDGSWAQSVASCGWKAYSSDEIDSLQTGDVLIAHAGALYSTKGHHGEIYINENQTFGWGSVKSSYPTSNSIQKVESGGHVHYKDSTHDYVTIYRYEG